MKKRFFSTIILAPIFLLLIWLGGYYFLASVLIIFGLCAWEFARIYDHEFRIPIFMLVVMVEIMLLLRWYLGLGAAHRIMTVCLMAAIVWGIWACEVQIPKAAVSFAVLTTGVVYIGWLGGYMISLRQADSGFWKLVLVLCLTWMNDIGAYLIGKPLGRHHILPHVSPKKTWEGCVGGFVFTMLTAFLMEKFIPAVDVLVNWKQVLILAAMISVVTPIGDFGESMIKRSFNVKDSSNLIPGHGGFFDRFDSVIWAMPIGYYFFEALSLNLI